LNLPRSGLIGRSCGAAAEGDRLPIPEFDFPAGLPSWMHEQDGWAKRSGTYNLAKRRNITLTVPKGIVQ